MSDAKNRPVHDRGNDDITIRRYFAAAVLPAIYASYDGGVNLVEMVRLAREAWQIADAMLAREDDK